MQVLYIEQNDFIVLSTRKLLEGPQFYLIIKMKYVPQKSLQTIQAEYSCVGILEIRDRKLIKGEKFQGI